MWCCAWVKPLLLCPVCAFLWLGRCGGLTRKVSSLPTLRGWTSRSRRTSHMLRPPGRPCRESPGLFVLSLSHSLECSRQWVVNPPAQLPWIAPRRLQAPASASPRLIKRLRCRRVDRRLTDLKAAPSNASAASESTTAGGLEAFSQGIADAERNLSPSR